VVFKSPLQWPQGYPKTPSRKVAMFSARRDNGGVRSLNMTEATKRLREELARHGVRDHEVDVVISTNMKVGVSGLPRADQGEPGDPGVSVYWEANGKSRNMAIDIYTRVADNIAAVAATLEAMRAIERHGGKAIQDKAFAGFDALPAPDGWRQILGLGEDPRGITKETIVNHFKARAAEVNDHRGMPTDMGALVKARDEALAYVRGE
jgi:hypothetical protein